MGIGFEGVVMVKAWLLGLHCTKQYALGRRPIQLHGWDGCMMALMFFFSSFFYLFFSWLSAFGSCMRSSVLDHSLLYRLSLAFAA